MTVVQKLKPYDFHGVEFNKVKESDTEAMGVCPFCDTRKRIFHVNIETGQYNCKSCGSSGNVYTYLKWVWESSREVTTTDDYKALAQDRPGIKWQMLRDEGFALDPDWSEPRWLIPVYNLKGSLSNLRIYSPGHPVMATSGLSLLPFRLDSYRGDGPIIVCEGEWDALAVERIRRSAGKRGCVIGVPGANVFKNEWRDMFSNRDVYFWYDNDGPGEEGAKRSADKLNGIARTVRVLKWPSTVKEGWDVRDHIHENLDKSPKKQAATVWQELVDCSVELTSSSKPQSTDPDLPKIGSFRTVVKKCRENYHMDKRTEDALAVMYATVLSIQLPGDPLWMFIVGPPGAGKTMFLRCFEMSPWCIFKSSLTPRSLVSGYRTEDGSDPSLIPRMTGKVLVLKDYTEIMTMPRDQMEEMYGILRGAYDGHVSKIFGNGQQRDYAHCHFAMLAGVTDEIHGDNRASLGERFLKFQMLIGQNYDPQSHIEAAIRGLRKQQETEIEMQRVAAAFSNKDLEEYKIPQLNKTMLSRVVALSQVVAYLRASIPRNRGDEMSYRPTVEIGTRLAKQISKLGMCLSIVLKRNSIDEECYRIMRQVGLDTAYGWPLEIMLPLMGKSPTPCTKEWLQDFASLPSTTCHRQLENMRILGAVERTKISKNTGGRPQYGWKATPHFSDLWQKAKLPMTLSKKKV